MMVVDVTMKICVLFTIFTNGELSMSFVMRLIKDYHLSDLEYVGEVVLDHLISSHKVGIVFYHNLHNMTHSA